MSNNDVLPQAATPDLIRLMHAFKKALYEQIIYFDKAQDTQQLGNLIAYFSKDLESFKMNFEHWYQDAKNGEEFQQLEALAKELGEAQGLIFQATKILKGK